MYKLTVVEFERCHCEIILCDLDLFFEGQKMLNVASAKKMHRTTFIDLDDNYAN